MRFQVNPAEEAGRVFSAGNALQSGMAAPQAMNALTGGGGNAAQFNALRAHGGPTVAAGAEADAAQYITQGLVRRGMPPHIAQAFVLNMQDESGLNPGINEIEPVVPGSRGGFGLYQLTGPRRRSFEAFAAASGAPLDSIDAQLDFLILELQGPERSAAQNIFAANSTGEAAAAIVNDFLRPLPQHRERRARRYLGY